MGFGERTFNLRAELKEEFIGHMIPFWKGLRDREYGGYYGLLDYDLKLDKHADKGCILNSRIMWFFSRAYSFFKKADYLADAKQAYDFFVRHFCDGKEGGVYWSVSYDGEPADDTKHTYNQAFAIYALSAYYEASGDRDALKKAYQLRDLIETKCRDEYGYLEAFTVDFRPASNEKLSENGVMASRTMNTLLHVLEAYTELYRVDRDDSVKRNICEILNIFRKKVYNPEKKRLEVFFDMDYNPLIDLHSFGHDIEAAWLIDRAVSVIEEVNGIYDMRDITGALTSRIYSVVYPEFHTEKLIDRVMGGVPAESENGVVLENRIWWVQCEAMIGFMNGYQEKRDRIEYLEAVNDIWKYIRKYMIDSRPGAEWYSEVDMNGKPVKLPVASQWKCPYHNGRMFLEILSRCGETGDTINSESVTEML